MGKTHFIDSLIERYKQDDKSETDFKIIKISLFGVSSFEDIDERIFQAIHPKLSSNGMKIFATALRSFSKFDSRLDLGVSGLSKIFNAIFTKKIKFAKNNVIIVDDFERAVLKPSQIFGYFSEIVSDVGSKVIFIGNEEKISENDKNEYSQIKEKTIGIEFEIEPDKEEAINSFISEFNFEDKDFIKEKTIEIASKLDCLNLRTIRQALYNFNFFSKAICSELKEQDRKRVFEIFMVLFIQKTLNFIVKEVNINLVLSVYFNDNKSYRKYIDEQKKSSDKDNQEPSHKLYPPLGYIPLLNLWKEIIFNGKFDRNFILSAYKNEKAEIKEQNKPTNLIRLINEWRSLDKSKFEPLVKQVFSEFGTGKYLHPGEILLFYNYFVIFSKWGLIPQDVNYIESTIWNFLNKNKEKIIPVKDLSLLDFGYGGYGFSRDLPEFNQFFEKLKDFNDDNVKIHSKNDIKNEVEELSSETVDSFCRNIIHVNGNDKYYKIPILSYIDISVFYEKLIKLSIPEQEKILNAFSERYGKKYSNEPFDKEYAPDLENLKKLEELYAENQEPVEYNPQALFRNDIVKELKELVDYVERKTEN